MSSLHSCGFVVARARRRETGRALMRMNNEDLINVLLVALQHAKASDPKNFLP